MPAMRRMKYLRSQHQCRIAFISSSDALFARQHRKQFSVSPYTCFLNLSSFIEFREVIDWTVERSIDGTEAQEQKKGISVVGGTMWRRRRCSLASVILSTFSTIYCFKAPRSWNQSNDVSRHEKIPKRFRSYHLAINWDSRRAHKECFSAIASAFNHFEHEHSQQKRFQIAFWIMMNSPCSRCYWRRARD